MKWWRELAWLGAAAAAAFAFGVWRFGAGWWERPAYSGDPMLPLLPLLRPSRALSPYALLVLLGGIRAAWIVGRFGWRRGGRVAFATGAAALGIAAVATLVFVLGAVVGGTPLGEDSLWLMAFALVGAQCWIVAAATSLAAALRPARSV